jgi:hypothetical protein
VALALIFSRSAKSNSLINKHVVPDFGGFADYDTHAVVDDEASSDFRGGVNFDASYPARALRNPAGNKEHVVAVKPVGASMPLYSPDSGV